MGAKIQAFDIFQTPLSSHYPLPLIKSSTMVCLAKGNNVQLILVDLEIVITSATRNCYGQLLMLG